MLPIPFGNPNTYAGHSGVDYPVPRGSVIRASGPGTVVTRARNDAGGFYVFVKYDALPYPVGYHHMDSHNGVPAVGTRVQEGSQLGFVGSLGARSTGPHLHSEVSGHRTTAGYWQFFDRNRVVGTETAAGDGDSKPMPVKPASSIAITTESEEDDMRIIKDQVGTYWLVKPNGMTGIKGEPHLELLRRVLNSKSTPGAKVPTEDLFNAREIDIIKSYLG